MRRLAIRPGGIGDFILSLPALECLAQDPLEIWTAPQNVSLVRFTTARSIPATGLDLLGIAFPPPPHLLDELRKFDAIVSWYGSNRPEFRDLVLQLGLPFTFFPALPPKTARIHAVNFYLDQVTGIVECRNDGIPRIPCATVRENFAAIHPFSGNPGKNWPLEKYRAMARRLERVMPVRWCAGVDDPPLENAVRIPDLYDLACWLAGARLYIGNDSGVTHLAAAVGTPVLALFGPTDPQVWAPRGPHVRIARWGYHSD
jgi:hypothetical protein